MLFIFFQILARRKTISYNKAEKNARMCDGRLTYVRFLNRE